MADVRTDLGAERALLGVVLHVPLALATARVWVRPPDFAEPAHGFAFDAIGALADRGVAVDRVTLEAELAARGQLPAVAARLDLEDLDFCGGGADRCEAYARIVADHAAARRLRAGATALVRAANTAGTSLGALREAAAALLGDALRGHAAHGPVVFAEYALRFAEQLEKAAARGPGIDGLPTGLPTLDGLLSGLHGGELVIVGARPRVGKSALVMQMAVAAATASRKPVLGFSLEMSGLSLFGRTAHARAGVDATLVRTGMVSRDEVAALIAACAELADLPIYLDDAGTTTVDEIRAKATAFAARPEGLALVFCDYLQLLKAERERGNRQLDVAEMSGALKQLARSLDVPVVVLSQLSRECDKRPDKRPVLSDLRDSGSLEQDADVVIFLYRDVLYNPKTERPDEAEVIVAKQRNGPPDTLVVRWEGPFTRFVPLEREAGEVAGDRDEYSVGGYDGQ